MKRRAILQALATAGTLPQLAWGQDKYPSKPITLICPYAAGGNADQRSRQIGRYISTALGQPVIVDDKPGAGGNIGTDAIAKAKPDGYVIGMGNFAPLAVNPTMFKNITFDPAKDLVPICLIERGPLVLMVNPNSPYKSVQGGDRGGQGQARQPLLRLGRPGRFAPPVGRVIQIDRRPGPHARSVQGRGAGDHRSHGGPGRHDVRADVCRSAVDPRRQAAGAGDHQHVPVRRCSRTCRP